MLTSPLRFFNGTKAACFPCGTGLGATFNLPLLHEAGVKMGAEAKSKGAHVILGPTINMQRSPLGGRGFESLGEDPVLAGLGAAALVGGIQSTGVQATIKHFVCNDQEHRRNATQAVVSERALREIYAKPFQLAVRDAAPAAFMTSYNGVNGTYCSENPKLLGELLRGEWGWEGLVMSDWYGTYSTREAVIAGLDLEMPGPARFRGEPLKFSVETDKVREHVLDERVRTVLEFVKKCAASGVKEGQEERAEDTPETAALLRKIGGESLVLLKNEGGILPFKKDKKVRRDSCTCCPRTRHTDTNWHPRPSSSGPTPRLPHTTAAGPPRFAPSTPSHPSTGSAPSSRRPRTTRSGSTRTRCSHSWDSRSSPSTASPG